MNSNFCIFTENFTKLSDLLIPLPVFNKMVQYVEGLPEFMLMRKMFVSDTESYDISNDTYVLPYPYLEPLYDARQLAAVKDEAARSRIVNEWKHKVFERSSKFAENGLMQHVITEFDNDPDHAVIIHITSGTMVFFHYSCIKDLSVLNMHCRLPQMASLSKLEVPDEVAQRNIDIMYRTHLMDARYRQVYVFDYIKQDPSNPTGQAILATTQDHTAMSIDISTKVANNILTSVKAHKKIILTA